ncbi:MAG: phosphatidylserine decarboxylase family protein [Thermodesulfovibrionales bacterium]|nr:phosphatidylserine decarboxylase family protein [Thermodesulfovibrionales bacterium]
MIRFAPEGYPFIVTAFLIAVFFLIAGLKIPFILSLPVLFFLLFFFRDPERIPPPDEGIFVAPADGKVITIKKVFEDRYLMKDTWMVSIFMSPLDVHVNRSPQKGIVKKVVHNRGKFLAAYRDEASIKNENIEMVLETPYGEILVRQVAGVIARRAVCRAKEGDVLKIGQRYGMIKFSSRLDTYLPSDTDITVKLADRVKAGESIIGRIR